MLLWALLLVPAVIGGKDADAPRPVISLSPPWTTVFEGETVLLTCNGFDLHSPVEITWYHNTECKATGKALLVQSSGEYRCQIQNSASSKPVKLEFSSAPLILQAPVSVFQGESMVLKCLANRNVKLTSLEFYKNNEVLTGNNGPEFHIHQASLKDNGEYFCRGAKGYGSYITSNTVKIQVEELFPSPVLTASPSKATVGTQVTLTCEVQLPSQKSGTDLMFRFFRDGKLWESGRKSSLEFQISGMQETEFYWCSAKTKTSSTWKESNRVHIHVDIALSQPVLTLRPPSAQAVEGETRELNCEAHRGSPPILYQFYHQNVLLASITKKNKEKGSISLSLTEKDSGKYYCTAQNAINIKQSETVSILVTVPVSQPVLTLSPLGARTAEGDVIRLYCEARRGSPPIQYKFYHDSDFLWSSSVSYRGGGVSLKLSLTTEHSGRYYCTAENRFATQKSEAVSIFVTVPVSRPTFTLWSPRTQAVVGDLVKFYCEAQQGSLPILYKFYHEDNILWESSVLAGRGTFFSLSLTEEHSGKYFCGASNSLGTQQSQVLTLSVKVPVSQPVLTLRSPRTQVGDVVELHCESQRGSPPVLYRFYHENVILGSKSVPSGGGAALNFYLTEEHSGSYRCTADNDLVIQSSDTLSFNVSVPVSRPTLTLWTPRTQEAVVGDLVRFHCEAQKGSLPILYQFYHEDVTLWRSSVLSGKGTSFSLSLTEEHSGNYSCEASNTVGAQLSQVVTLSVKIPVSSPVLSIRPPGTRAVEGDTIELHCYASRGSLPILYRFYYKDVIMGNSSVSFRGGVSFNLSLTIEHSGNYSCEADNGLGTQRSEAVSLSIIGLTGSRSGSVATGVTGGLFSMMGLAAVALLLYSWLLRKPGRKPTSVPTGNPSNSNSQEPTYYNVPAYIELQPVYSNVNLKGGEVIYTEVRSSQRDKTYAVASAPRLLKAQDSSVIYTELKVTSTPASSTGHGRVHTSPQLLPQPLTPSTIPVKERH